MRSKTTAKAIGELQALQKSLEILGQNSEVEKALEQKKMEIPSEAFEEIEAFDEAIKKIDNGEFSYAVRGKSFNVKTKYESIAGLSIPKVAFPRFASHGGKVSFY